MVLIELHNLTFTSHYLSYYEGEEADKSHCSFMLSAIVLSSSYFKNRAQELVL